MSKQTLKTGILIVLTILSVSIAVYLMMFNEKKTIEGISSRIITNNDETSDIGPDIENNIIYASSIELNAPIIWDVRNTEEETEKNLNNGVIHLQGTAKPGNKGNIFITGHSSDFTSSDGKYKEVFASLEELTMNDEIFIKYNEKMYDYKMIDSKIINPNDLSVLEQGNENILTMVTCVPVGTNDKRLVIIAKQFYPFP